MNEINEMMARKDNQILVLKARINALCKAANRVSALGNQIEVLRYNLTMVNEMVVELVEEVKRCR